MYRRSVGPLGLALALLSVLQIPIHVSGDGTEEDPRRARLRELFSDPTVGEIVVVRASEVTFARDAWGTRYPVYSPDRPRTEVTTFRKPSPARGRAARVRLADLTCSLSAILRYRDLLASRLDLICAEAAARDVPAELALLTLGTEAEYLARSAVGGLEEWTLGLPGAAHLRDVAIPINVEGARRPLWDSTLGLGQTTPRIVRELVEKGYLASDFAEFCRERRMAGHQGADDGRHAFEAYAAYALTPERSIRAHIAYLGMVADDAGLTPAHRRQTLPMMQLMFAHYHSRVETRFDGFREPAKVLRLAFEEFDTQHYPHHRRFRGYGALLAPASATLMAALSVALDLATDFDVRSVVDLRASRRPR